jgi:high-affinity nickel-transport protein
MHTTPLALLGLGFALGLRHALDVDHLAAVSTLVSTRRSLWGASMVGAVWGFGHTAALLIASIGVIALHTHIPPEVARGLELCVALMLVGLGANLLRTLWRGGHLHLHPHTHDGHAHVHPHVHEPGTEHRHQHARVGGRPFLVGLVHGLAGSAGLMLVVLATIPSPALAFGYVAVFGAGSIGGMMAMSSLLGVPLALATERFERVERLLKTGAALASIAVGVALAWSIGMDAGLLS